MKEMLFWGTGGEYGPFSCQEDGWPNAGEVIRYYRKKLGMSAEELAQRYGETIGVQITARWIFKMEQQNKVPTDISRRRILINILDIPPALLGLALLETTAYHPTASREESRVSTSSSSVASPNTNPAPPILVYSSLDLEWYSKEARLLWKLHYAQTAQDVLADLITYMNNLAPFQQDAKGNLKRSISELMNSYARLAATLQRDGGNFKEAYIFANESVRLAKDMGSDPYALQILAASQYTRGVVNQAWGSFGDHVKRGKVILQKEKLEAALTDFERALIYASPQLKGILYSEMARVQSLLVTSATDITIARTLMERAEHFVDMDGSNDFYAQILLNGDMKGLDKRRLILGRAKTFLAIQRPEKVIEELDELEDLNAGPAHSRRTAWTDILYAQASLDLGNYATAADKATSAFNHCHEVHAIAHLARVQELYMRLLTSYYRDHAEVKHLGKLLGAVFPRNFP